MGSDAGAAGNNHGPSSSLFFHSSTSSMASSMAGPALGSHESGGGEATSPLLIRSSAWQERSASSSSQQTSNSNYSHHHHHSSVTSPPVAPAVVLSSAEADDDDRNNINQRTAALEQSSLSSTSLSTGAASSSAASRGANQQASSAYLPSSPAYGYPVATFVRDLVRTGIDHVHEHVQATGAFRSDPSLWGATTASSERMGDVHHPHHSHHTMNSGAARYNHATAIFAAAAAAATTTGQEEEALTVRTLDDLDATNVEEFIIVDGDLVAVPPPPPNHAEQEGYEDHLKDQVKTCQPNRLRRHVRRFNRFFFKRRPSNPGFAASSPTEDDAGAHVAAGKRSAAHHRNQQQHHQQHHHPQHSLVVPEFPRPDLAIERRTSEGSALSMTTQAIPAIPSSSSSSLGANQSRRGLSYGAMPSSRSVDGWAAPAPIMTTSHASAASSSAANSSPSHNTAFAARPTAAPKVAAAAPQPKRKPKAKRRWRRGEDSKTAVGEDDAAIAAGPPAYGSSAASSAATSPPSSYAASVPATFGMPGIDPLAPLGRYPHPPTSHHHGYEEEQQHQHLPHHDPYGSSYGSGGDDRAHSVTASFVGTADQLLMAGVLPAGIAAEAYIEYDDDVKSKLYADDDMVPSLVPSSASSSLLSHADYKVDKCDGPDFETMLQRAAMEARYDLESSHGSETPYVFRRGKSDTGASIASVPLSISTEKDGSVHNDMLKVVMVGNLLEKSWLARAIRENYKRPPKRTTLALDVRTWAPSTAPGDAAVSSSATSDPALPVKFQIWDTQGATSTIDGSPNFGGHPATQSLFFSPQALYVLVWDLAGNNCRTFHRKASSDGRDRAPSFASPMNDPSDTEEDDDDDDDEEDYGNEFAREEANRQADRALHAEIRDHVLAWVDCIVRRAPRSAVLPVAIVPEGMDPLEVTRRCNVMQNLLEQHVQSWVSNPTAPKLLCGADDVLRVSYNGQGLQQLRETLVAIATDASKSVFDHVGSPVPYGTQVVLDACRRLKSDHSLLLVDHLMFEIGSLLTLDQVIGALHFLASIGEILYFGRPTDDILSRYIVLSRKWLVSAISCILRNDLKRELAETRRFMNMQCLYSNQRYEENEISHALTGATTSSCPLLSDVDAQMLWQSMSFMREAADRSADLGECPEDAPTLFAFLERLLVASGVLVPVAYSAASLDRSQVFFVPSLLAQVDPREVWTYRTSESWMTTLCHSWLFRDGAPTTLMEGITVGVLRDLYELSRSFQGAPEKQPPSHVRTVPMGTHSLHEFYEDHGEQPIGRFRIHQIMCWQTSVLIKVGTVFADPESNELRESFVEMLITVVDQSSDTCVASDAMRLGMQRVILCGKGQVGRHARKIWKGGYQRVLDSIQATLRSHSNVDAQVVCPECLAHSHPHNASTWSLDSVKAAADAGSMVVRCMRGHRVDTNLICGTCKESLKAPPQEEAGPTARHEKPVTAVLPSVVLVGLWDPKTKKIKRVGSGFVVDRKVGLVVTAAHVLFSWEEGPNFGTPYEGAQDAKVVIGVLVDDSRRAVFRYFGEIVSEDVHHVDACVVRITTRMECDVDDEGPGCADQPETVLDAVGIHKSELRALKMAKRFDLEESVRILGFNQGGEGVFEQGAHVNRHVDVAKGYICAEFRVEASDESSSTTSSRSTRSRASTSEHRQPPPPPPAHFVPREEIVIMCPTIPGHSGGPCVNEEGRVVGILSRADPVSRLRCYLVPHSELRPLVKKARKRCQDGPPFYS